MERDRQIISKAVVLRAEGLPYGRPRARGLCNRTAILILIILSITMTEIAGAKAVAEVKDYGVVGHTYAIKEHDIIEYIKTRLSEVDLKTLENDTKTRIQKQVKKPSPIVGITKATEPREYYYDPTFTIEEDVVDHTGKIIYPRRTTINPLSKVGLTNALIFIDGDDKEQIKYALTEHKKLDGKVKIVLINGSPTELMEQHKVQIYFDQDGVLTTKLGVKHVPATVVQDDLQLKIKDVVLK